MDFVVIALQTSISTVGRAQFMAGIVNLAYFDPNGLSQATGYLNAIFGGAAILYDLMMNTMSGSLAVTLQEWEIYAQMSALGSGLIGLLLFLSSMAGTEPASYSQLTKLVNFYADSVALLFGTLHVLVYMNIICFSCGTLTDPSQPQETPQPSI